MTTKTISYDSLVIIEDHLTESVREMNRNIIASRDLNESHGFHISEENIRDQEAQRDELQKALKELSIFATYIANHGEL